MKQALVPFYLMAVYLLAVALVFVCGPAPARSHSVVTRHIDLLGVVVPVTGPHYRAATMVNEGPGVAWIGGPDVGEKDGFPLHANEGWRSENGSEVFGTGSGSLRVIEEQ